MSRMTPTERYHHDTKFRMLVDALYSAIDHADYTPTEIREAVMLAQIQYEELHIRPLIVDAGWPGRG